jgi:histidyl-tRNA synthetase
VIIGQKTLAQGKIEIKARRGGQNAPIDRGDLLKEVKKIFSKE